MIIITIKVHPQTYPHPEDRYGLLSRCWERKAPGILKQLENILEQYGAETILDCCCETDLYSSGLKANGWRVSSINTIQDSDKYDAVICMDNEFIYYKDKKDFAAMLRVMLEQLNEYGIAVFGLPDFEGLSRSRDKRFLPLLIEEEIKGKRGSVIQYICMCDDRLLGITDFIYHMKDLNAQSLATDWETMLYEPIYTNEAYDAIADAGGCIHGDYLFESDRIYIFGRHEFEDYVA